MNNVKKTFRVEIDETMARIIVYLDSVCRDCIGNMVFAMKTNHQIELDETRKITNNLDAFGLVKIEPCTKDRDGDASLTERGESAVVLCQSLLDQWYPPPEPNHILTWRCSKCGAWHKKQGYHYRTVAAQVPEADEFCSDGCPFNTRESDDGYYCILGLHEKPQGERECKPGPECLLNREG